MPRSQNQTTDAEDLSGPSTAQAQVQDLTRVQKPLDDKLSNYKQKNPRESSSADGGDEQGIRMWEMSIRTCMASDDCQFSADFLPLYECPIGIPKF